VAKENILMSDIEGGREGGHVAFSISTIIKFKISTILCNKCTFMYIYIHFRLKIGWH
jgi:hypothetical protein